MGLPGVTRYNLPARTKEIFMRYLLPILPIALLLTGCAGTATLHTPHFLHQVPAGTLLALERPLHFKAGTIRVYLQDGQPYHSHGFFGYSGINRYRVHCMLELRHKPSTDFTLSARDYRLDAVRWETTYLMADTSEFRTEWRLSGGGEPQAYTFTCSKADNAAFEPHLTLEEIDHAVGDYFRLKHGKPL